MTPLSAHCGQQLYIADLRAKGVNDGGILALLSLRFDGKQARAAMRFFMDRQARDFDADDSDAQAHVLPARICGEAA